MKDRLISWLPLLPLLLLLAATYWLNKQVQPAAPAANANLRHDPDYIISNFTATSLDTQGKTRFTMSAQKMWHYPDDDSTHMEAPQLLSMLAGRPPMRTSALRGTVSSKGDEVFLYDDVLIVRPAYAAQSELKVSTNYLHAIPDQDLVDTDHLVTVTNATTSMQAVGMELNNKARTVKLLSRVKSTYEPVKR
jgi:lipopolysaccharide export system protein LptC